MVPTTSAATATHNRADARRRPRSNALPGPLHGWFRTNRKRDETGHKKSAKIWGNAG
jgi:hypothetical protein